MGAGVATSPHCPSRDNRRRDAMRSQAGLPGSGRDQARPVSGPGPDRAEARSVPGSDATEASCHRSVGFLRAEALRFPRLERDRLVLRRLSQTRRPFSGRSVGTRSAGSPLDRTGPKPGRDRLSARIEAGLDPCRDRTEVQPLGVGSKQAPPLCPARTERSSVPATTGPRSSPSASDRSKLLPAACRLDRTEIRSSLRPDRDPAVRPRTGAAPAGTLSNAPGGDSPGSSGILAAPPCPMGPGAVGKLRKPGRNPVSGTAPPGCCHPAEAGQPPFRASAIEDVSLPATK
jgi:hypothetical protein